LFPDAETVYTNELVEIGVNGGETKIASCMVMGDNTCNSFDSRAWGTVSGGQYQSANPSSFIGPSPNDSGGAINNPRKAK